MDSDPADSHSPATAPVTTFRARLASVVGTDSVRGFARRAGVSDTFLRQCLSGNTEPTRPKLAALAAAGAVSVEWLATGRDPGEHALAADPELIEAVATTAEQVIQDHAPDLDAALRAHLIRRCLDTVRVDAHGDPRSRAHVLMLLREMTGDADPFWADPRLRDGTLQDTCHDSAGDGAGLPGE